MMILVIVFELRFIGEALIVEFDVVFDCLLEVACLSVLSILENISWFGLITFVRDVSLPFIAFIMPGKIKKKKKRSSSVFIVFDP